MDVETKEISTVFLGSNSEGGKEKSVGFTQLLGDLAHNEFLSSPNSSVNSSKSSDLRFSQLLRDLNSTKKSLLSGLGEKKIISNPIPLSQEERSINQHKTGNGSNGDISKKVGAFKPVFKKTADLLHCKTKTPFKLPVRKDNEHSQVLKSAVKSKHAQKSTSAHIVGFKGYKIPNPKKFGTIDNFEAYKENSHNLTYPSNIQDLKDDDQEEKGLLQPLVEKAVDNILAKLPKKLEHSNKVAEKAKTIEKIHMKQGEEIEKTQDVSQIELKPKKAIGVEQLPHATHDQTGNDPLDSMTEQDIHESREPVYGSNSQNKSNFDNKMDSVMEGNTRAKDLSIPIGTLEKSLFEESDINDKYLTHKML